ncbi:MAG: hypothetical protein ACM3ZC_14020 [Bacteroidota bacterium]
MRRRTLLTRMVVQPRRVRRLIFLDMACGLRGKQPLPRMGRGLRMPRMAPSSL